MAAVIALLHAAPSAGQTATDDLGRTVSLRRPPNRIVSLAPSITESLFAIGAGGSLVGVTDYCSFPPEARAVQRIGGLVNPSIEKIVALQPDLIVLSMEGNLRQEFDRLLSFEIPVAVTNPRTLEGIYRSLTFLGTLTGHRERAASLVRSLREREHKARAAATRRRPGVLLIVSLQPLIVAGAGTFLNELLVAAGAVNLGADALGTYPTLSREAVAAREPDMLLVLSDAAESPVDIAGTYPEWRHLKALRRGTVVRVDSDLLSRPGPRAVDALEYLVTILHGQSP